MLPLTNKGCTGRPFRAHANSNGSSLAHLAYRIVVIVVGFLHHCTTGGQQRGKREEGLSSRHQVRVLELGSRTVHYCSAWMVRGMVTQKLHLNMHPLLFRVAVEEQRDAQ
jgi:hypothetical protein